MPVASQSRTIRGDNGFASQYHASGGADYFAEIAPILPTGILLPPKILRKMLPDRECVRKTSRVLAVRCEELGTSSSEPKAQFGPGLARVGMEFR